MGSKSKSNKSTTSTSTTSTTVTTTNASNEPGGVQIVDSGGASIEFTDHGAIQAAGEVVLKTTDALSNAVAQVSTLAARANDINALDEGLDSTQLTQVDPVTGEHKSSDVLTKIAVATAAYAAWKGFV